MAEFSTSVKESGDICIINLKGFLDAHTAPTLENNFTQLINDSKYKTES